MRTTTDTFSVHPGCHAKNVRRHRFCRGHCRCGLARPAQHIFCATLRTLLPASATALDRLPVGCLDSLYTYETAPVNVREHPTSICMPTCPGDNCTTACKVQTHSASTCCAIQVCTLQLRCFADPFRWLFWAACTICCFSATCCSPPTLPTALLIRATKALVISTNKARHRNHRAEVCLFLCSPRPQRHLITTSMGQQQPFTGALTRTHLATLLNRLKRVKQRKRKICGSTVHYLSRC